MAGFSHTDFIAALESKLDYQSARTIAKFALDGAGLAEKAKYDGADAQALLDALKGEVGGRADAITQRLSSAAAAPAAKPAAKTDGKAAAKAAPAKSAAKPAAKAAAKATAGGAKKK